MNTAKFFAIAFLWNTSRGCFWNDNEFIFKMIDKRKRQTLFLAGTFAKGYYHF